jgi:hypothetical protein
MLRRCLLICFYLSVLFCSRSFPSTVKQLTVESCEATQAYDSSYEELPIPLKFGVTEIWRVIDCYRDDISAASTLIIAAFTIILSLFTVSLARSTRKAANSAVEASNAVLATERGTIVETIRHVAPANIFWARTFDNSPTMPASECDVVISLYFRNYGKTPATLYYIDLDAIISDKMPALEPLANEPHVLAKPTLAQNEQTVEIDLTRTFNVSWKISRALSVGAMSIYVVGTIIYNDVFGNIWKRTFIWEYLSSVRVCRLRYEKTDRDTAPSPVLNPDPSPRGVPRVGKIVTPGSS